MTALALDASRRAGVLSFDRVAAPGLVAIAALVAWEGATARPVLAASTTSPATFAALTLGTTIALWFFVARCVGHRAGLYAIIVLATMPAWFVRTRADGAALALPILSLACIGIAVLDARLGIVPRLIALAVAAICGWLGARTAGLVILIGAPSIAVGAAHLPSARQRGEASSSGIDGPAASCPPLVGAVALGVGSVIALSAAVVAFASPEGSLAAILLGPGGHSESGGFARPVGLIAYALAPWTPLIPFALTRRAPTSAPSRPSNSNAALTALVLAAVLTLAAEAALSSRHGAGAGATFACGALAACIGAMLADLDRSKAPSALLAIGVFALGGLVAHDLSVSPDRVLDVLAPGLPAGHAAAAARSLRITVWVVAGATTVALLVDPTWLHLGRLQIGRGSVIVIAGLAGGLLLRIHAYPDLIARISPGRAFEAWADRRKQGDQLALLGVDEKRWPRSQSQERIATLNDAESGAQWLLDSPGAPSSALSPSPRHFLAIGPSELPRANAAFRARSHQNLPIVAGEGAFLLGVSTLVPGERSENPLDAIVRSTPPDGTRPLAARLGDSLELLGWDVLDARGRSSSKMPSRGHLRISVRVTGSSPLGGHCTFIHIDHTPTRYGAEHREHPYPMSLWREGDVIVDDFEVVLPPHFTAGSYPLYWGVGVLPCQDDRRIPVADGPSDGHDRVVLGRLEVR